MPRHGLPRQHRFPQSVVRPAWQLAAVFLMLTLLSSCSLPFDASPSTKSARSATPAPTATSTSPLAVSTNVAIHHQPVRRASAGDEFGSGSRNRRRSAAPVTSTLHCSFVRSLMTVSSWWDTAYH
jgi:hypothetical protein